MKTVGRKCSLGIGKESVRGTAVAPTYWIPWATITNPDDVVEYAENSASIARLEELDGADVVKKHGEVGWSAKMKDDHFGLICLSHFGTDTPVARIAPNAAVYDHTYTIDQTVQHASLTVALKDPNVDYSFPNTLISTLDIECIVGQYIMYTVTTMSKASASSSTTPAHTTKKDFKPQQVVFKHASTQAGLDAASAVVIRSIKLQSNANVVLDENLGSVSPTDVNNQTFRITMAVTKTYSDEVFKAYQDAGTYRAFRLDIISDEVIGTSANPEFKIDLHRAFITNWKKDLTQNGLVVESFDITATYSLTDAKMVTPVLTNLVASY